MDRSLQHAFEPEEVMAYLDGELEPKRAALLAGHMQHCSECQLVAQGLRSVSERMLTFEVEPVPAGMTAETLTELNAKTAGTSGKSVPYSSGIAAKWRELLAKRSVWAFAGVTAIVIVAIGLVTIPRIRSRGIGEPPEGRIDAMNAPAASPASQGYTPSFDSNSSVSEEKREALVKRKAMSSMASSLENDDARESYSGFGAPASPPNAPSPDAVGPMIVQTASLSIVANNYDESGGAIEKLVAARGGYVEKLDAKAVAGNAREINVTLRIPGKQLGDFLADVRKLGHVTEETQSNEEVSAEYVDLQARLRSAQASETRLIELLQTRTGKLEDVLDAERELARVRADIEAMQGQSTVLVHRVNYASVEVDLSEEYHEKLHSDSSTGTKLRNATVDGLRNLEDGVLGLLIFGLNYGLSILFWLAVVLVPVWLVWRRLKGRRVRANGGAFQTP